jgi:hypothetical protein
MPKFKIGDRVKCIAVHDGNQNIVGQTGTVRYAISASGELAIEFDNNVGGHALTSTLKCERGHGWYVAAEKLVLIPKPKHDLKIIIYRQGNKVFAKYVVDKRMVAETCATCSPEDTFSVFTGAQIALARLSQPYDAKPAILKEALDKALENFEIIE